MDYSYHDSSCSLYVIPGDESFATRITSINLHVQLQLVSEDELLGTQSAWILIALSITCHVSLYMALGDESSDKESTLIIPSMNFHVSYHVVLGMDSLQQDYSCASLAGSLR